MQGTVLIGTFHYSCALCHECHFHGMLLEGPRLYHIRKGGDNWIISCGRGRSLPFCISTYITYSLHGAENPSWEANRFSASQEFRCILWNPKVRYRIHKGFLFEWFVTWFVLRWGVVSTSPNLQAGGPHLLGCPRRIVKYVRSYPPTLHTGGRSSTPNLRTRLAVVTGTHLSWFLCANPSEIIGRVRVQADDKEVKRL